MANVNQLFTIGHSNRSLEEFLSILKDRRIELLVDVRKMPRSRSNPQFNYENLLKVLPDENIDYIHCPGLTGLRKGASHSINSGWQNKSFRAFADYMQTPEFDEALRKLFEKAEKKRTVLMCAEAVPWRCHRSLIADAAVVHGWYVEDLIGKKTIKPHLLRGMAKVVGNKVTYPPEDSP